MNLLRCGTKFMKNASPAGLLFGGTVLVLSMPFIRKGLRCAAVLTARGFYSIVNEANKMKNQTLSPEEVN